MSKRLRSDMEKMRKELARLAKEIAEIKGQEIVTVEDADGKLRYEPKKIVAIEEMMRDMTGKVNEGGILIHAGYIVKGRKRVAGWANTIPPNATWNVSEKEVTKFLSPFSSEQRVVILRSLFRGIVQGKTVSELVKETGFEGGQLYHHLRELERANYVETGKERGRYFISIMGMIALLTVSHMAMALPEFLRKKVENEATSSLGT